MNRLLLVGFDNDSNSNMIPMVSSRDAKNVDIKIDDGKILEGIVHGVEVGEDGCMDDNIDYSIGDDKGKCVLAFYEEGVSDNELLEGLSGTQEFFYTGGPQEFVVPSRVKELKLEVWGASGAILGGNGGYSIGTMTVTTEKILYVYVGGVGSDAENLTTCSGYKNGNLGGWNGGGNGGSGHNIGGGGGGATDVRTRGGEWNDENSIKTRLIVAGGGGGGVKNWTLSGGNGGGYNATCTKGQNGAQDGGACGINSNGIGGKGGCYNGGGGGGGYYGGNGGGDTAGAGGGSGYCGINECGGSAGVRAGDGMARICWGNKIEECNGTPPDTE
jgi:hypothetical protein